MRRALLGASAVAPGPAAIVFPAAAARFTPRTLSLQLAPVARLGAAQSFGGRERRP